MNLSQKILESLTTDTGASRLALRVHLQVVKKKHLVSRGSQRQSVRLLMFSGAFDDTWTYFNWHEHHQMAIEAVEMSSGKIVFHNSLKTSFPPDILTAAIAI